VLVAWRKKVSVFGLRRTGHCDEMGEPVEQLDALLKPVAPAYRALDCISFANIEDLRLKRNK